MAENAGHLVVVGIHTAIGGPYVEIDGVTSVSVPQERTSLETTNFADATGHKTRITGLKDTKISLSGNIDYADSAQSQLRSRYDDGASTFLQIKFDGAAGTGKDGEFKVVSYQESAEVDGLAEFSCELEGSPLAGAANIWS